MSIDAGSRNTALKLVLKLTVSVAVIVLAVLFLLYPAATLCVVLSDSDLRTTGQSRLVPGWFESAAGRYSSWADKYLQSEYAASLRHNDIAPTEWPIFGSTFVLVTAEDLHRQGKIDATDGIVREAVENAVRVVVSPVTATWVRTKWGDGYLEQENVFYRMLLILGLSSYENITGNTQYRATMTRQRISLAGELAGAHLNLRDDYPDECYPADMLWAVAAIQRAARLENTNHNQLARSLMESFDGPVKAPSGLPVFQADAESGKHLQGARGCGNSGILLFASELDRAIAAEWYRAYESNFWKNTGWVAGFAEQPHGTPQVFMDVDSGPVCFGIGSVASAFGIGAAKTVGRIDHAAVLTLEGVACSWPTPFGFVIPGLMGLRAADSWSLGEVALLFSMTRPVLADETVSFDGPVPGVVWILLVVYAGTAFVLIGIELRSCRNLILAYRAGR